MPWHTLTHDQPFINDHLHASTPCVTITSVMLCSRVCREDTVSIVCVLSLCYVMLDDVLRFMY